MLIENKYVNKRMRVVHSPVLLLLLLLMMMMLVAVVMMVLAAVMMITNLTYGRARRVVALRRPIKS